MEMAPCVLGTRGHTASLLTSLNLQRERAQFCDCVVRQKDSPAQLYPAHRCILAASSPVLESVLSSAGALVELQAPCLSGSSLALLLDYIYTGDLPCTCTREQYYSLLDAAHYLRMDELERAIHAWQQPEANDADKTNIVSKNESQPSEDISKPADAFTKYLPSTCTTDAGRILKGTEDCSLQKNAASSKINNTETTADTLMRSSSTDPCINEMETVVCGSSGATGAKRSCGIKDAKTIKKANTCSMSESSGNTDNCRQVSHLTLQNPTQNISSTTEGYSVSRVRKDMQKDQFHPAGIIKDSWQNNTDEEMEGTDEGTRRSSLPPLSTSSSSSPHPCCGAVPVICHSSRASMFQPVHVSTAPSYRPVSLTSVNSSMATLQSASTENENIAENTEDKKRYEFQELGHRNAENQTGPDDDFDQCTSQNVYHKSIGDQTERLIEKSPSSKTEDIVKLSDNVASDDEPQRADWSGSRGASVCAAAEERPDDVPLSGEDSDVGSDSYRRNFRPRREVKEEHVFSVKCPAEMQTPHPNCYRPETDWYSRLQRAEASTNALGNQHEPGSNDNNAAIEDRNHSAGVCLPLLSTPEPSLENVSNGHSDFERRTSLDDEKILDTESSEPVFAFTIPEDSDMSDPMCGKSYHGHVHYHCVPQDDTHLSHGDSGYKHPHTNYHDHSNQSSEEGDIFGSPGHSPLGQHFATGTSDQFLLLDISTKHSELLVSYNHGAKQETQGMTFDREQRNEATSVAGPETRKASAVTKLGLTCFDQVPNEDVNGLRETNGKGGKSAGGQQSRSRAEVKNKAGVAEEAFKHEEDENHTSTLRVCSAPSVPESARTSLSSTLSVCIPSSLPASMSTNISAHLSASVHHAFQCSLCDRSFSQRGSLNRHVRSHLGVRPFPCPRCPMTFSRQYRVTEHMRVHQRCTLGSDLLHPHASAI